MAFGNPSKSRKEALESLTKMKENQTKSMKEKKVLSMTPEQMRDELIKGSSSKAKEESYSWIETTKDTTVGATFPPYSGGHTTMASGTTSKAIAVPTTKVPCHIPENIFAALIKQSFNEARSGEESLFAFAHLFLNRLYVFWDGTNFQITFKDE